MKSPYSVPSLLQPVITFTTLLDARRQPFSFDGMIAVSPFVISALVGAYAGSKEEDDLRTVVRWGTLSVALFPWAYAATARFLFEEEAAAALVLCTSGAGLLSGAALTRYGPAVGLGITLVTGVVVLLRVRAL